ncbi:MEK kinase, partial [Chytriomyces sp. MP71]
FCRGNMIGQGSFGAVYFGVNLATNELIAVKQVQLVPLKAKHGKPSPSSSRVQKMVEALSVEISLLRELSHEHVVRYLGFDVVDHVVSVFLEYVDGGSLASMLSRYGRFEYGLAQSVTNQMLSGLEYLHDRCIIHRDIKGANILVNKLGVVKIADFGISKKNEYKYQTNSRMSVQGTVFWMAPEVMTNKGGGYSAKVDIWSLGCVVYEMLQGHHPWQNLNEMQIMWKVGMEKAAPPVPDNCREDAKEFLARCFVVEPESRPTARELFSCIFPSVDPAEFDFK